MKNLNYKVFPSEAQTISVEDNEYDGAHLYAVKTCLGFENGQAIYTNDEVIIPFVKKTGDAMYPGLQSEQLAYILLDRCVKLNAKFPSAQNTKMILGLQLFLDACEERVQERIERGVMGQLKK